MESIRKRCPFSSLWQRSGWAAAKALNSSVVLKSFYQAVAPRACLWNTPDWLWNNDAGNGFDTGPWRTVEVRGWMEELGVRCSGGGNPVPENR